MPRTGTSRRSHRPRRWARRTPSPGPSGGDGDGAPWTVLRKKVVCPAVCSLGPGGQKPPTTAVVYRVLACRTFCATRGCGISEVVREHPGKQRRIGGTTGGAQQSKELESKQDFMAAAPVYFRGFRAFSLRSRSRSFMSACHAGGCLRHPHACLRPPRLPAADGCPPRARNPSPRARPRPATSITSGRS